MKSKLLYFALFALILGSLKGFLIPDDILVQENESDHWRPIAKISQRHSSIIELSEQIRNSGLIFMEEKETEQFSQNSMPDLPEIIALSTIDGRPQAHIRGNEGQPRSYGAGDWTESGWKIEKVNFDNVVLKFEEYEDTVFINEYNSEQLTELEQFKESDSKESIGLNEKGK